MQTFNHYHAFSFEEALQMKSRVKSSYSRRPPLPVEPSWFVIKQGIIWTMNRKLQNKTCDLLKYMLKLLVYSQASIYGIPQKGACLNHIY